MTDIPTIAALPAAPARGQDAAIFVQKADAFIDALAAFVAQMNAFGAQLVTATQERVVNEAGASYTAAANAANAAIAARDAAQGYAGSVNPATLVHVTGNEAIAGTKNFTGAIQLNGVAIDPAAFASLTGDQAIDGIKTFTKKIVASLGIRINGQDLTGLTAAGKALIEAADLAAQKTLLGVGVEAVGGVGALVIAASTSLAPSTFITFGTTVAGSTLTTGLNPNYPMSLGGSNFDSPYASPAMNPGVGNEASLGLSGTWRLQTTIRTDAAGSARPVGLWKRIV